MPDLLFEIQTEELPPEYLSLSENVIRDAVFSLLNEYFGELPHSSVRVFSSPRQLAVFIKDLPERGASREVEIKGPPVSIAYSDGKPTRALEGFLRSNSASPDDIFIKEVSSRSYVFLKVVKEGIHADRFAQILADHVVEVLQKAHPKKMFWANRVGPFARPVRGFVLLLDDRVVPFEKFGVSSGRTLKPHRFAGACVDLKRASDYLSQEVWEKVKVIPDRNYRARIIKEEVSKVEGVVLDEDLVWHNADLTGYPRVFVGLFDQRFRALPVEVARTVLASQLKCFICVEDGELSGKFVGVSDAIFNENVRAGYERVVRARFSDAEFFYRNDLSSSFDEWNEALKGTVYLRGLGSIYDKEKRLGSLVKRWNEIVSFALRAGSDESKSEAGKVRVVDDVHIERASEAASICKADLSSEMVYEFPELEGVMGRIYALKFGYPEDVAWAIEEHYLPKRSDDLPPERIPSILLSLLDKLDTIVGVFGIGKEPSGSADPFAVRRAALGIVRISSERDFYFPVPAFVDALNELFSVYEKFKPRKEDVLNFVAQRAYVYFQERNFPYHFVRAVLKARGVDQFSPSVWFKKLKALSEVGTDTLESAAIVFRRVSNIVDEDVASSHEFTEELLREKPEIDLYHKFVKFVPEFEMFLREENYAGVIHSLLALKPFVDKFFDDVLVNVEDPLIKANRHRLLWKISKTITRFVDFSCMVL